ncbi:MAG: PH domain-containing protein [Woeseiaceae bacterium]|nr:PH domain-containing protein [Woeseiaceae bacterium]
MSYVDSNLMSGEDVIYKGTIHWFVFIPGLLMFLISLRLMGLDPENGVGPLIGVVLLIFSVLSLLKAIIAKATTELAVTSKRVIAKIGFIRRNTIELNHQKVESFVVDQSILGRIFGYGTLVINGTGGGKTPIANIAAPLIFRKEAMQVIDAT